MRRLAYFIAVPCLFAVASSCSAPLALPVLDPAADAETQIESLLAQMTLEEKVGMIHASSSFTSGGVERLGIPELIMSDGPHGVRHEHTRGWDKAVGVEDASTYLPVGTALAATWNKDLGYEFGSVLGSETAYRGKDVILGPGLNIIRDPLNGRNFEYMTEDPYLNARMAVGYVKGVQEHGVAVSAKHYIANSLEYERKKVNVEMDERAFREIYLPGFKAAVQEGGALTVMAAYNRFRGDWCAQSEFLLDEVLKGEMGFEGLVMSDWSAVNNSLEAVQAGLDIEMGTELGQEWGKPDYDAFYMADPAIELVKNGTIAEEVIDDKVRRILRVMHAVYKLTGDRPPGAYNTAEHQAVARRIADESIVLLKNEGLLPLRRDPVKTLAVIGANANRKHAGGGGSSQVKAYYEITALEGLRNLLGDEVEVTHAPGYAVVPDAVADEALIREAVDAAAAADAVVFVGGLIHGFTDEWDDNAYDAEFLDKPDMMLPFGQDELIEAVLAANPNTVIALQSGGPVDMRAWEPDAKAIIQAWYGGMEGGTALAAVLFGDVNPSGRLPMTFPVKLEDSPAHALASYPDENLLIDHTEGLYVGYRYFDAYDVEPAFPFGHGLSYTTFEYSDLSVASGEAGVEVRVQVTNTGSLPGAEVVQVYVSDDESSLPRPAKELKEFGRVELGPGVSTELTFVLGEEAFSYYSPEQSGWVLEPGTFTIQVGSSSRDIRVSGHVDLVAWASDSSPRLGQSPDDLLQGEVMAVSYSGFREGQHPDRGDGAINPSADEIFEDLQIMLDHDLKLIRMYDSGPNTQDTLKVIREKNLPIKVALGIWLDAEVSNHEGCPWLNEPIPDEKLGANALKNEAEVETGIKLAKQYDDIIVAVNVGNEALVDWNDHMMPLERVIGFVRQVKAAIQQPVTVAENYDWWRKHGAPLAAEVDFLAVHSYPAWEEKGIDEALDFTIENIEDVHEALPGKQIVVFEAGWATIASEFGERASEANQKRYTNEVLDWATKSNVTVFFFEAFDEPWKGNPDNVMGAEKHWGLFNVDRTPKEVVRRDS